jgi:hypothetical protein
MGLEIEEVQSRARENPTHLEFIRFFLNFSFIRITLWKEI